MFLKLGSAFNVDLCRMLCDGLTWDMHDQTRRSRGEVHIKVSVVSDGTVKEVVEEIATMNISVRHLIIATVIRRLYVGKYLTCAFIRQAYIYRETLLLGHIPY